MGVPKKKSWKVEKVVRKVEGFGGLTKRQNDAGKQSPSSHAGIALHREERGGMVSPPCSRKAHARVHRIIRLWAALLPPAQ